MNPIKIRSTITTKFIMPMLFSKDESYKNILSNTFINAYLADFDKPEYDDHILLVFEEDSEVPGGFKAAYIEGDNVVYAYDIPEEWSEDYFTIMVGAYSEISNAYKQHLLNFWQEDESSDLYKILYKKEERGAIGEQEKDIIWSKVKQLYKSIDITKEIYNMGVRE